MTVGWEAKVTQDGTWGRESPKCEDVEARGSIDVWKVCPCSVCRCICEDVNVHSPVYPSVTGDITIH